eukprot:TRINITY_DN30958_c0_g1_i1.p1 TRINITY_DN30958_c0_g1~~TRINITY_DN30958_c0_g1_i1.p1  ORF type:complete len:672 (-),score=80.25 TRINITY_DN30958_c0_g1_i1:92-2107(-)
MMAAPQGLVARRGLPTSMNSGSLRTAGDLVARRGATDLEALTEPGDGAAHTAIWAGRGWDALHSRTGTASSSAGGAPIAEGACSRPASPLMPGAGGQLQQQQTVAEPLIPPSLGVHAAAQTLSAASQTPPRQARALLLPRRLGQPSAAARSGSTPAAGSSAAAVLAGAVASGRVPATPGGAAAALSAVLPSVRQDSGADLAQITSLTARLAHADRLSQYQAAKLARQTQELEALRAAYDTMCAAAAHAVRDDSEDASRCGSSRRCGKGIASLSAGSAPGALAGQLCSLRAERDKYRRQVEEMISFLKDYGLTWVGDINDEEASEAESHGHSTETAAPPSASAVDGCDSSEAPTSGSASSSSPHKPCQDLPEPPVDLESMRAKVAGLNASLEHAATQIITERGAARFASSGATPLPLTFFRDGVKLARLDFQVYEARSTQQLVADIMDGYFPYALKDTYPDGTPLKVVDRTALMFAVWLKDCALTDAELLDAGNRLAPAAGRILCPGASMTQGGKFVRAGEICEAQGANTKRRGARSSSAGFSASAGGPASPSRCAAEAPGDAGEVCLLPQDPGAARNATRLQVKLHGGLRVVLAMEGSCSVGQLECAIDEWSRGQGLPTLFSPPNGTARSVLRTAFPPRAYTDSRQTLLEAGLVPSATLFTSLAHGCEPCH